LNFESREKPGDEGTEGLDAEVRNAGTKDQVEMLVLQ
jgi:hypothetical protein